MEDDGDVVVTPGEVLGKSSDLKAGTGAYVSPQDHAVYASLTGFRRILSPPPDAPDQRPTVEVTGHKAHGPVPEPGSIVTARVTRVMARMASADIMCVGTKSVREKFSGIIRQQDVRATEIDKVDMHLSFRAGDIVRALVRVRQAQQWFQLVGQRCNAHRQGKLSKERLPRLEDDEIK